MCTESYLSLNLAQKAATRLSLSSADNTTQPVEVLIKTESQVAVYNTNDTHITEQNAGSAVQTASIAFPKESYIQQGLQIIKSHCDVGVAVEDIREYRDEDEDEICTSITTKFNHDAKIFFPSDTHMMAAAAYYKQKYGINIHIVCEEQAHKTYELMQQLNDGEQLGIIARPSQRMLHVTPLIISRRGEDIFIVSLDSIDEQNEFTEIIEDFIKRELIKQQDKKSYHLIFTSGDRLADSYSCRNDALVILKDALKKPNVIDCFKSIKEISRQIYSLPGNKVTAFKMYRTQLPAFLFKTVQRISMLETITDQDKDTVLKTSIDRQTKTLQAHFNQYKRSVAVTRITCVSCANSEEKQVTTKEKKWIINEYLRIKGFLMLVKVFTKLSDE